MRYLSNEDFKNGDIAFWTSEFYLRTSLFLKQLPRDASIYSVKMDSAGDPTENTMKEVGERVILVVVELDAQNNN